jgi:hypothetical protein
MKWKITGRIEIFSNLGKLFGLYKREQIGVSRSKLDHMNLYEGYHNDTIEIYKKHVIR